MSTIAQNQEELAGRLNADDYFSDVSIITERQGDMENRIDQALKVMSTKGGKIGVAVLVGVVSADVGNPDAPGPHFNDSFLDITIFEQVLFNSSAAGTGKSAIDIAVRVAQVTHQYYAAGIGQTVYADREAIRPLGEVQPGTIAYKVRIRCPLNNDVLAKVERPVISPASGAAPQSVTITCPTSGASIYYTVDGSYPWSGNAAATLYAGAFNVAAAAMVRAVAHKSGSVASDAAAVTFT